MDIIGVRHNINNAVDPLPNNIKFDDYEQVSFNEFIDLMCTFLSNDGYMDKLIAHFCTSFRICPTQTISMNYSPEEVKRALDIMILDKFGDLFTISSIRMKSVDVGNRKNFMGIYDIIFNFNIESIIYKRGITYCCQKLIAQITNIMREQNMKKFLIVFPGYPGGHPYYKYDYNMLLSKLREKRISLLMHPDEIGYRLCVERLEKNY